MAHEGILSELRAIRKALLHLSKNIEDLLAKDNKINIATTNTESYSNDLYALLEQTAEISNPVLEELGVGKEKIITKIEKYVKILEDNNTKMYFASVNIDAKYNQNKTTLNSILAWLIELDTIIEMMMGYLETETEEKELGRVFEIIDSLDIPTEKKEELKKEILNSLNRLNGR
jgi:hypothetical protein